MERTINWNKYQSKVSTERQNQYLDYLIDPTFQGVNRFSVLSHEDEVQRASYKQYYPLTLEMKIIILWLMVKTFLINQYKLN